MSDFSLHPLQPRNTGLDAMRSVALLMVFCSHGLHFFTGLQPEMQVLSHVFRNGVEMFFSLSGFLIGNMLIRLLREKGNVRNKLLIFYRRRTLRIFPLYFTGIVINLAAGLWITGNYRDFNWKFLVFLQNLTAADFYFFPVSYSLTIEVWFYLLFPLAVIPCYFLLHKKTLQAMLVAALAYILLATAARYYVYMSEAPHWDAGIRKTIVCRLDAALYGILLSVLLHASEKAFFTRARLLLFAGIASCMCGLYGYLRLYDGAFNHVWYFNLVPLGFALSVPWFYSLSIDNLPAKRLVSWLSRISFAFYIVHLNPVTEIVWLWFPLHSWPSVALAFSVYTIGSFAAAQVLHTCIEVPFLKLKDHAGVRHR